VKKYCKIVGEIFGRYYAVPLSLGYHSQLKLTTMSKVSFSHYYDEDYHEDGYDFLLDGQVVFSSVGIKNPTKCIEFVNSTKPQNKHEVIVAVMFFRECGRIELPTGNPETDKTIKRISNLILSKQIAWEPQ